MGSPLSLTGFWEAREQDRALELPAPIPRKTEAQLRPGGNTPVRHPPSSRGREARPGDWYLEMQVMRWRTHLWRGKWVLQFSPTVCQGIFTCIIF